MQRSISHQEVTGLTVNKKVNVRNSYYRNVRAMSHSLFKNGFFYHPSSKSTIPKENRLKVAFQRLRSFFIPNKNEVTELQDKDQISKIESVEPILGMLAHIYNIKSYRNKFVRKGFRPNTHDGIRTKANGKISFPTVDRSDRYEDDNHVVANDGVKNLYGKVLFFKHFFFLKKPLIICEGKTDNIYLKCAIDSLSTAFPELAKDSEGVQKISFFNRTNTNSDMLKLAEGTPGLEYLISIYKRFMEQYKCEGKMHPVIFIVDNDGAGNGLINKARKIRNENRAAKKIKSVRHTDYYFENLYIVSIPTKTSLGNDVKDIEDLFDATTLSKKLNGKTFHRQNTGLNPDKHYGKAHFAEHVVKAQKKSINYNEFSPLLAKLVDIIKSFDHKKLD